MPEFKVLILEPIHAEGTALLQKRCELIYPKSLDEQYLIERARDVDAIIKRAKGDLSARLIHEASRLKVIGKHGVGLDGIDLKAARQRGIRVVYTPEANAESVAEHFVGLALTLAKKIRLGDIALRQGDWEARNTLIGTELYRKTLGVLGLGRIGTRTAWICRRAFEMSILYYDMVEYPEKEEELQASRVDIEELFARSDFISVNLPLVPRTKGLIDASLFKLMKPTAFIINMARGPIWKEQDLLKALNEGWIAGAASDVYEVEPTPRDNPLFLATNFVGTPHMAAHAEESMRRMSMVAKDILAVLDGRDPEFPVPEHFYE